MRRIIRLNPEKISIVEVDCHGQLFWSEVFTIADNEEDFDIVWASLRAPQVVELDVCAPVIQYLNYCEMTPRDTFRNRSDRDVCIGWM